MPSVVEGPGHTVIGQSNVVKATDGSTTVIGGQNFVADTAKDGNIFGDGSSITGYQSQAGGDNNHLIGEQNSAFGMNKDQIYNLIGRPHFKEGFVVREWDYLFNSNGTQCQFKILFDKNMNVGSTLWNPTNCVK